MAMPQTQSPHGPSPADVSSGFGAIHPPRPSFCTPDPLPSSVSSGRPPRSSRIPSTMATAFPQPTAPKDQQHGLPTLEGFGDSSAMPWAGYPVPMQYAPATNGLYDFNAFPNNFHLSYSSFEADQSCPRSYTGGLGLESPLGDMSMSESHPPAAYVIEPPKSHDEMDLPDQSLSNQLLQLNSDCDSKTASNIKIEDSPFNSPYGSVPGTPSSMPDGHPVMRSECNEDNTLDKEQPYAQLIYRALMGAPGKTMVLRDIYNWFKENTDKAADKETKGWQNSIRHNLSMNGAFEKVDQPCEDAKKGFMWKLTDEAVRVGVKSTTRYRSKQPNKRGHRSQNPLPQRQASGAKGGNASRRSAKLRRSQRGHDTYAPRPEPYMCRSVPSPYDRPTHDPRHELTMPTSYPGSPYYNSDLDFGMPSSTDDFSTPLIGSGLDFNPYSTPAIKEEDFYDAAYMNMPKDPSEPLFYGTDDSTSSPSASEPRTPDSQGDCYMDMGMGPAVDGGYHFAHHISSNYPE